MNIGAEIPFRRSRRDRQATGSLIFDREREMQVRKQAESKDDDMRVWSNGHFSKP
ncbi:hypothetical protein [Novosphingobium mangrovi (ex Huang et al. 2023)]|uniref:Uncharacterized protein n=1 Tax=Novosphingobium mangrovi (ex Huang et al. 2023) TaxID=2976432 RepID=A0ABT2I4W1_9SPHN|nr:hypothetical protein [Novosphingobium mangrovi (ex Huang et al. 2023)]MCT2399849.1 hypothetical protein [Novosphingobium mangrovi (ex Huang et al. 2023)]